VDQGSTGQPTEGSPVTGGGFNQELSRQVADLRQGFNLVDFLTFRYMITPPLITVIYIVAVIVITLAALATLNVNVLAALFGWVLAMLWVRVVFEVMIVLFRINDGIQTIARRR